MRKIFVFYSIVSFKVGLEDMAKKYIKINISISVNFDNYHNKCHIIYIKFKDSILLLSEGCGFKLK